MGRFDRARELYAAGKRLLDVTRDGAVTRESLRWAREDLEDVLLDLKLAFLDQNPLDLEDLMSEATTLMNAVWTELNRDQDG